MLQPPGWRESAEKVLDQAGVPGTLVDVRRTFPQGRDTPMSFQWSDLCARAPFLGFAPDPGRPRCICSPRTGP